MAPRRVQSDHQVPTGVAEPALARGLLAPVAVVVHEHLLGQNVGDGVDVVAYVGDHPDAELVGDLGQRVGVEPARRVVRALSRRRRRSDLVRPVTDR